MNWLELWRYAKRDVPDAILFLKTSPRTFQVFGDDAALVRHQCQNWLDLEPQQEIIIEEWRLDFFCEKLIERGYRVKVAELKTEVKTP